MYTLQCIYISGCAHLYKENSKIVQSYLNQEVHEPQYFTLASNQQTNKVILEVEFGTTTKNHKKYCQGRSTLRKYPESKTCNKIFNKLGPGRLALVDRREGTVFIGKFFTPRLAPAALSSEGIDLSAKT